MVNFAELWGSKQPPRSSPAYARAQVRALRRTKVAPLASNTPAAPFIPLQRQKRGGPKANRKPRAGGDTDARPNERLGDGGEIGARHGLNGRWILLFLQAYTVVQHGRFGVQQ